VLRQFTPNNSLTASTFDFAAFGIADAGRIAEIPLRLDVPIEKWAALSGAAHFCPVRPIRVIPTAQTRMLGVKIFKRAAVTISGIELLNRVRKGQFH
jgi:hypothetical protein